MKRKLILLLSFSFILLLFATTVYAIKPPIKIYKSLSCFREFNVISPYFTNIFSSYMILTKSNVDLIKNYIKWYFENLNYPDVNYLNASIYDFWVIGEELIPTKTYDSIDAYAGTFLTLVYFYVYYTKDYKFLRNNLSKLKDIAYLIVLMRDVNDGLIRALPNKKVKYLINNLEAQVGLALFALLLKELSDNTWIYYITHAMEIEKAIRNAFFDEGKIYWAIEENKKYISNSTNLYPDKLAEQFWFIFQKNKIPDSFSFFPCEQRVALLVFGNARAQLVKKLKSRAGISEEVDIF